MKYSPGSYTFTLGGNSGDIAPVAVDFTFRLTLTDPCPFATLLSVQEFPFVDLRYVLGRDPVIQPFDYAKLVSHD